MNCFQPLFLSLFTVLSHAEQVDLEVVDLFVLVVRVLILVMEFLYEFSKFVFLLFDEDVVAL